MLKPADFPRDYWPMLSLAQELQFYDGFLTIDGQKQRGEMVSKFKTARTAFVDDLINRSEGWWGLRQFTMVDYVDGQRVSRTEALCALVAADLADLARANPGYVGAIDSIQMPLIAMIRRNGGKSATRRKVERYTPYVVGAIACIASAIYLYYNLRPPHWP